jgi:hypothetical protein
MWEFDEALFPISDPWKNVARNEDTYWEETRGIGVQVADVERIRRRLGC